MYFDRFKQKTTTALNRRSVEIIIFLLTFVGSRVNSADTIVGTGTTNSIAKDLIIRMGAERERIVQYKCTIVTKTEVSSVIRENLVVAGTKELMYEYSRLEDHRVVAQKFSKGTLSISGWSGPFMISHKQGTDNLQIYDGSLGAKDILRKVGFDPLAVGLSGCFEFRNNFSFERGIAGLMTHTNGSDTGRSVTKGADGVYEFRSHDDLIVKIDSKRGYWPIFWKWTPDGLNGPQIGKRVSGNEWRMELTKFGDLYVPSKATVSCDEGFKSELEYHWESINEPFATGMDSAEKWAKSARLIVEDSRRKK